jgi:hypothetical protein
MVLLMLHVSLVTRSGQRQVALQPKQAGTDCVVMGRDVARLGRDESASFRFWSRTCLARPKRSLTISSLSIEDDLSLCAVLASERLAKWLVSAMLVPTLQPSGLLSSWPSRPGLCSWQVHHPPVDAVSVFVLQSPVVYITDIAFAVQLSWKDRSFWERLSRYCM